MISIGQESGVIDKTEKDMLDNIFEFDHKVVKEVMTPRGEVFAIKSTTPNETIAKKLISEQFSRVPVYNETRDNIVGILYLKDFFEAVVKVGVDNIKLDQLIRPAYFVLENKAIDDLFKELQDSKQHMAVIIDEYGGFSGIVTIEDLIEEVMGDIFIISAIMGLQLVGCGSSNDSSNKTASDNKPAATTENKSKVVDDDSLVNEVAEVYLDLREEYLEVLENKQMNEWNEEKADALKDLKEIYVALHGCLFIFMD